MNSIASVCPHARPFEKSTSWFEQHDECTHMCIVCHGLRRDLVHEHVYARKTCVGLSSMTSAHICA